MMLYETTYLPYHMASIRRTKSTHNSVPEEGNIIVFIENVHGIVLQLLFNGKLSRRERERDGGGGEGD